MESSLLDAGSAAAFLKKLGEHLDYNINIMDRDGVIIASRDPSRIGNYHDAAQRLVATGAAEERVEPGANLPAGMKPGVNLPIVHRGETIGVVGVTGSPSEVGPLAYAIKTSVESMIELEAYKDKAFRRQDRKNLLINFLLYEDDAPRSAVEALADKLGYHPTLPRAPLLLLPPKGIEAAEALLRIKGSPLHGMDDISCATPEGHVLVFKALRFDEGGIVSGYESRLEAYVEAATAALGGGRLRAWAGAFQLDFGRYRGAYRQAHWLAERFPEPAVPIVFLYDHLLEFLASRIPRAELVAALDGIAALLPQEAARNLRSSIDALSDSALNGKEAAARLGVHRNTFSARMERLARLLGRDPRRDPRALDLLSLLSRYYDLRA
ncbi:MAG: helix-turn-helix domain-containing protein [Spirochaetaceae bacterium]|nr:helix-turn-helix domain-containing protein [Spirochaetaceae bacterium]